MLEFKIITDGHGTGMGAREIEFHRPNGLIINILFCYREVFDQERRAMYVELLHTMLKDMQNAPPCFQPTHYWTNLVPMITHDLETYGFENFRASESAQKIWVGVGNITFGFQDYLKFITNDNDNKPPHIGSFGDNLIGKPIGTFKFNEINHSTTSLNYLKGLAFLKKYVDTSVIRNVIEIGGGFGMLGSIFLQAKPEDYFYVDVDLPPLAAVSTYYLQQTFGKDAILDYSKSREMEVIDIEELRKNYRGAVLCPWQLPKVKGNFELAVNYISFQEMEPDVVQNYIALLDSVTSHYMLLRNARYGKETSKEVKDGGVIKQVVRQDYIDYLTRFKLMAIDSNTFGSFLPNGFESEAMIFKRIV